MNQCMNRWMNRLAVPLVLFVGGMMLGLIGGLNSEGPTIQASTAPVPGDWISRTMTMLTAAGMVSGAFLFLGRRIWAVASEWQSMTSKVDSSAANIEEVKTIVGNVETTVGTLDRRVSVIESNCVQHRG